MILGVHTVVVMVKCSVPILRLVHIIRVLVASSFLLHTHAQYLSVSLYLPLSPGLLLQAKQRHRVRFSSLVLLVGKRAVGACFELNLHSALLLMHKQGLSAFVRRGESLSHFSLSQSRQTAQVYRCRMICAAVVVPLQGRHVPSRFTGVLEGTRP